MTETPILMPFQDLPFNGDIHICEEFLKLRDEHSLTTAVETGSCFYSSTEWFAENFEKVYTVEISADYSQYGLHKIIEKPNVHWWVTDSVFWLPMLKHRLQEESCIFFLDAHWGEFCPLKAELQAIINLGLSVPPLVAIHDFKTENPDLGFDTYKGQPFSIDWIQQDIKDLELAYKVPYEYHFNKEATGAMRGIVYITPKIEKNELDTPNEEPTPVEEV